MNRFFSKAARTWVTLILRILLVAVFLLATWTKLSSDPASIDLFSKLEMEPQGRYVIGFLELLCALLLLRKSTFHWGALLGFCVMIGAVLAHTTVIGWAGDLRPLGFAAMLNLTGSAAIIFIHKDRYFFLRHD